MSDAESERDSEEPLPASVWEELGLPEPTRLDDRSAPPVDRMLLRLLVRKQLSKDTSRALHRLIRAYASWNAAFGEIVAEEYRRNHPAE